MLALTRKIDEALIIDGKIQIKILDIQGDKVKIGIEAPKEIAIYREEVYSQIQESNKEALTAFDEETLTKLKALLK